MPDSRHDSRWTDARLAALEPAADWRPDASRMLGRLHKRRARQVRQRNWFYVLGAAAALLIVLGSVAPRACANPRGCGNGVMQTVFPKAAMPAVAIPAPVQTPANFKQVGNPAAPVTIEIYSDFECPHCAVFHKDTLPMLLAEYVKTGKVKIIYRDHPMSMHLNARLAARYANAAGAIGKYDVVVDRLFRTQDAWSVSGDIAGALAPVLTFGEMQAIQRAVDHDANLDTTVAEDLAAGQKDQINGTPTLVVVSKGKPQTITPIPAFPLLKSYLDSLLAK